MEEKKLTGYPSIDKPWLKYYDEKAINTPLPQMSMYNYLWKCNKDYLDNTALNYFGKKTSYKKMFENIDCVACALQASGVKKGDIVSVCTLTAPETVYLIYAINKVGAVSNMLGLTSPVQDLHEQLSSTDSKLVFVVEMAYDLVVEAAKGTKVEKIVSIPIEYSMPTAMRAAVSLKQKHPKLNDISIKWKDFLSHGDAAEFEPVEFDSGDMALILYTGGTTGVPKGVMLSNYAGNSSAHNYLSADCILEFERGDTFLNILPPFLAFAIYSCTHMPLCVGVELILFPDPDPKHMAKNVINYKPNHFCCSPLHINSLFNSREMQNYDLSFVKTICYGGETETNEWFTRISSFLKNHGCKYSLLNGYGMTETAGGACTFTHKVPKLMPFANTTIRILNTETNQELTYGEEGELCISSPTLMTGYYNMKKETDQVLFEHKGQKYIHTGDLAIAEPDGKITITGRIKRIYWKKATELVVRVYPMRIEETIDSSPIVDSSCVVGKKDNIVGYRSIAFIILKDRSADIQTVKADLDKLCHEQLPESHIPDEYRFMESFPLTRAGKVDYRALEKKAEDNV